MTETEVEAPAVEAEEPAVEYPPERVRLPVALNDHIIILGTVHEGDSRHVGKTGRVVGADGNRDGESHYLTVDVEGDGARVFVKNWVHVWVHNLMHPLPPLEPPAVGDEVTILRALCCTACVGAKGTVSAVNGEMLSVDTKDGDTVTTHLADFTDKQVRKGIHPQDYVENNPAVKRGDIVYILRNETDNSYDYQLGTVKETRRYVNEQRDWTLVTMGNHREAWVTSYIRAEDVPVTMPPIDRSTPITILDVFGGTGDQHVGKVGTRYDAVHNKGIRVVVDGDYRRASQWFPAGSLGAESSHRQPIPKGTRVRVLSVKSVDRKSLIGKMGVTTADVDAKRDACIVDVDGERALVTGWTAVDKWGNPHSPRFLSMMTEEQVEALIQEVFDVADRLADKESWCTEYDSVMLNQIGREPGTIRLTQKWLVEVYVYGKRRDDKPDDDHPIRVRQHTLRLFAMGNASAPNQDNIRKVLDQNPRYKGRRFEVYNNWKEN